MVAAGADPALVARHVYQSRSLASVQLEGAAIGRMRLSAGGSVALSWVTKEDFARFGATKPDAEPLIDALRSLAGVRVACMLRDQGDMVRGSFRATDGTNVAELAAAFGGGGHKVTALLDHAFPEDVPTCPGAPGGPDTSGGAKGAQGGPAAGTSKGGGAA